MTGYVGVDAQILFFLFSGLLRTCLALCRYLAVVAFLVASVVTICLQDCKVLKAILRGCYVAFW